MTEADRIAFPPSERCCFDEGDGMHGRDFSIIAVKGNCRVGETVFGFRKARWTADGQNRALMQPRNTKMREPHTFLLCKC